MCTTCRNRTNARRQLYIALVEFCVEIGPAAVASVQRKLLFFSLEKYIFNIIHNICIIHVYYITNNIKPCKAAAMPLAASILFYIHIVWAFFSIRSSSLSLFLSFVSLTFEVVRLEICQSVRYYIIYTVCASGSCLRGCAGKCRCIAAAAAATVAQAAKAAVPTEKIGTYKTQNVSRAANKGLILLLLLFIYI